MIPAQQNKNLIDAVKNHPNRGRYVATHPMWGTEYSGPEAAVHGAFVNKATVICNKEESDDDAVQTAENLYKALGMYLVYLDAHEHDMQVAYVSHISHITSFALANTVLGKRKGRRCYFSFGFCGF